MDTDRFNLAIILFCLLMSAYFSATETAFSCINKIRMKNLADKGNKRAEQVLKLIDDFDGLITTILIGNNIVNILSASLTTVLFINWFGNDHGPSISTIVTTVVVLIFGEVTPKSIAKEYPENFAMFSCPLIRLLKIIFSPFSWIFKQWKKLLSLILKTKDLQVITEEELLVFVDETANDGTITEEESEMIHTIIKFSDLEAIDILTPRIDITAIDINSNIGDVRDIFISSGYSRIPVYEDDIDNVIGILNQKDFYSKVLFGSNAIKDILKPIKMVLGTKKIKQLLEEFKEEQNHMAIVASEYGSMLGLITLEDILEELVGEIWDEADEVNPKIVKVSYNEYIVLGSTGLHRLASELEINFDNSEITTVNGWIINLLERIPTCNEKFKHKNIEFEIISMNRHRIDKVKIKIVMEDK